MTEQEKLLITSQRASEANLDPQAEGESNDAFRNRVSAALRDMGQIIEAHEAYQNALFDDAENPMTGLGILGAVAKQVSGQDYRRTGETAVGDDIAAGILSSDTTPKMSAEEALLMIMLMGGKK